MEKPTPQDWAKWYAHKSQRDIWIEEEERIAEEQEENK